MSSRTGWRGEWVAILAVAAAIVAVAATLIGLGVVHRGSGGAASGGKAPGLTRAQRHAQLVAALASTVAFDPAAGATSIRLDRGITVTAAQGHLASVAATTAAGQAVAGVLAPSGQEWQAPGPLAPSTTYTVAATVVNASGLEAQSQATFTTLTPTELVTATISPWSGETVGVGEPISFVFNHDVPAAAQSTVIAHLSVAMTRVVPGGWHWFSDHELHFRPETYWPSGEQVRVTSNLAGWDLGNGGWGSGGAAVQFTVGAANISTADLSGDHMTVTSNGRTLWEFPISGGRTEYPTMDGMHIVMDKEAVVHMDSATVGIPVDSPNGYNEFVYSDVHISDSGEYVHAAPWSVGSQGVTNVSHGCINISPANAQRFYSFSQPGDIVNVINGPRPPAYGDHGVMDWSTPWSEWAPATVTQL